MNEPEFATISPLSGRFRWWLFLTGVAMPIAGIVSTFFGMKPVPQMYQAEQPWIYAALLLSWSAISVVLPLIIPCLIGLGVICIRPKLAANGFIRSVVYMGAVLATVYFVAAMVCAGWNTVIAGAIFGIGLGLFIFSVSGILRYWRRFSLAQLIALTSMFCFLAALLAYLDWRDDATHYLSFTAILALAATPALNALAYAWASFVLYRSRHAPVHAATRTTLFCGAFVAWGVSWKAAIDIMLDEYSQLPTDPTCYISSAAAAGHDWLVGRDQAPRERINFTNLQMRRCKFLEICLLCALPRLHRLVRGLYDIVGPPLAAICRSNVWFADVTYLVLKPVEWLAELLRRLLSISSSKIRELY